MCQARITVKDQGDHAWGVDFFSKVVKDVWFVVKAVYSKEKVLYFYRSCAEKLDEPPEGGTALKKFVQTRFLSRISMVRKYKANLKLVLQPLIVLPGFSVWLEKQPPRIRERFAKVKRIVLDDAFEKRIGVFLRVLGPVELMVRLFDDMRGSFIGIVYKSCLDYHHSLLEGVDGLPKTTTDKMAALFLMRWEYFHEPIYTVAFMLHPRYCTSDFSPEQKREMREYFKKVATEDHSYAAINGEYTAFINAIAAESYEYDDEQAFSDTALEMAPYAWHQTYTYPFEHLQYVAVPTGALRIGACVSETNWSVRGWMQDKRYNTRSPALVDSLVRLHSNILLEPRLGTFESFAVPWDVDCSIPEPPDEEPERHRSRRLSGAPDDEEDESPASSRRVFVDETDANEDDPFGDPDADLEVADEENNDGGGDE